MIDPKYTALFTSVNLLLGVGPLIIPAPFYQAGMGLSIIWIIFVVGLSYLSSMYIVESMAKVQYILQKNNPGDSVLTDQTPTPTLLSQQEQQKRVIPKPAVKGCDHFDQFEVLYGKRWVIVPILCISIYLTGTSISKCIMTGKTLGKVFTQVPVLETFQFWLLIFFLAGGGFSFRSVQKTGPLQTIIIGIRFVSFVLLFLGAIFLIIKDGPADPLPKGGAFNFDYFTQIFSNSVFSFLFHHSLPSIAAPVKNTTDTAFFIRWSFIISGSVLLLIPITGVLAFGPDLGNGSGQGSLKYYNFDFQERLPFVYYITSFYVFLNIAAFSVYIIVIRSNLMKYFFPEQNPKILNKKTAIISGSLLLLILGISWGLQNDIQYVLDFTGGIFGTAILFFLPCIQIVGARKKTTSNSTRKNYFMKLPYVVFSLGVLFLGYNLFNIVKKII